ncbi:PAS domain-containing protein [Brevundimonas denitrificans]|uniref:PAS domain-containing protein n=1 Tax=Brevundimonas denitrificans TaxID=1443434 RepID=UPI00223C0B95|nr:PAS domain S-box protein [Brevundimonas denitrificans]
MVEQAAAGIVKADLNGRILKVNDRFCEMLGYSRDEIVGMATADITHPDHIDQTGTALRTAGEQADGVKIEKRYRRKDGADFWALTSVRIGRQGPDAEPWLMAVVTDITDSKAAEAALRESESRFRLLADTAPAPVWLTNEEGEVEFVNEALVEFYGRPAEELRGHIWKDTLHPDDRGVVAETQADARSARRPTGSRRASAMHRTTGAGCASASSRASTRTAPSAAMWGCPSTSRKPARPWTAWPGTSGARPSCWA